MTQFMRKQRSPRVLSVRIDDILIQGEHMISPTTMIINLVLILQCGYFSELVKKTVRS